MEKIRQAVEKAKSQLGNRSGKRRSRSSKYRKDLSDLRYSQTKQVELNAAHLEKHRIVALNKQDPYSMTFDLLRTQVLQKMEQNGWRTLGIISPIPECGKTVVAINLAMSIAQYMNKSVMLVDFDLRRPKVASYLGLKSEKSLNDVLEDQAEVEEALVSPGLSKLVVLPTNKPIKNSAELLASNQVFELIQDFRDRYSERVVIFDLAPTVVADDTISLLPQLDCVLMVVGDGMVSKSEMAEGLEHLKNTNLLGTVLNKADVEPPSYYYDY